MALIVHYIFIIVHSSADRYLGCFYILATVNNAAVNIYAVHISFWINIAFLRNIHSLPQWLYQFNATKIVQGFPFLYILTNSSYGSWALEHGLSSCGTPAWLLCGIWNLPGPGIKPLSPASAGGFLSTVPKGKSGRMNNIKTSILSKIICRFSAILIKIPWHFSQN